MGIHGDTIDLKKHKKRLITILHFFRNFLQSAIHMENKNQKVARDFVCAVFDRSYCLNREKYDKNEKNQSWRARNFLQKSSPRSFHISHGLVGLEANRTFEN